MLLARFPNSDPMHMAQPKSFFRVFTEAGPLIAVSVAVVLLLGIVGPASAQFFNFGNFGGPPVRQQPQPRPQGGGMGGWFGGELFAPFQQQEPKRVVREDFSKAPPAKRDANAAPPERNIAVFGDGMADWLAYGLEDTYADQPEMGVIRHSRATSGLIRYQPKGEPADWAAAAKGFLANEKPDAMVVMLGLNDRHALREPAAEKADGKSSDKDKKADKKDAKGKPAEANKPADANKPQGAAEAAKPEEKTDNELPQDEADNEAPPASPGKR